LAALVADKSVERLAGDHAADAAELAPTPTGSSSSSAGVRLDGPAAAEAAKTPEKPNKTPAGKKSAKPSKKSKKKRKSHPRTTNACRCDVPCRISLPSARRPA